MGMDAHLWGIFLISDGTLSLPSKQTERRMNGIQHVSVQWACEQERCKLTMLGQWDDSVDRSICYQPWPRTHMVEENHSCRVSSDLSMCTYVHTYTGKKKCRRKTEKRQNFRAYEDKKLKGNKINNLQEKGKNPKPTFVCSIFETVLCSPGWLQTPHTAKQDLKS